MAEGVRTVSVVGTHLFLKAWALLFANVFVPFFYFHLNCHKTLWDSSCSDVLVNNQ